MHLPIVQAVLDSLRKRLISVNTKKCAVSIEEACGKRIGEAKSRPHLVTKKQVCGFLCIVVYNMWFIPNDTLVAPLTNLTKGQKLFKVEWNADAVKASGTQSSCQHCVNILYNLSFRQVPLMWDLELPVVRNELQMR